MFSYILRNTFSVDAKMYSKMPTEFFFGSSDCLLIGNIVNKQKIVCDKISESRYTNTHFYLLQKMLAIMIIMILDSQA